VDAICWSLLKPINQQYIVRGSSPSALPAVCKLWLLLRTARLLPFAAAAAWNGTSWKLHRRSVKVNHQESQAFTACNHLNMIQIVHLLTSVHSCVVCLVGAVLMLCSWG
jgi:hypothetical protein